MAYINMKNSISFDFLPVHNVFIDRYITKANAVFVCIYIYSLKKCMNGENVTLQQTAEDFNILESDVIACWKYWKKENVVDFSQVNDDFNIEFFDLNNIKNEDKQPQPDIQNGTSINEDFKINSSKDNEDMPKNKGIKIGEMPKYSVDEIKAYGENAEIKKLFKVAESAFSTMLDHSKMQLVLSFYEWLNLPLDVIEFLIKYCVSKGNARNLRYIEKVAIDWCDKGINTVEKAKKYVDNVDNSYKEIMKAFGQNTSMPIDEQKKYMNDWLTKLPIEIIKEACQRTVMKTGQPSFQYANSIILNWYNKGVKNFDDIKKEDLQFEKNKNFGNNKVGQNNNSSKSKKNNFNNYEQRDWDFELLDKFKGNLLDKKMKE